MKIKAKNSIVMLMALLLSVSGAMLLPVSAYADTDNSNNSGNSNSSGSEDKKIIICHVPVGNPANRHTIHIGFSAWPEHRDNHGGDYLGSCNNPPSTPNSTTTTTTTPEDLVVIKDCTGEYRKKLVELTQSYFDPVIVNDDALDDEDMVVALSQCLDRGDSSDSSKEGDKKNKSDSGKGKGHDSVSDSGNHHRISGCKNRDSSDSHKNSGDSKESDSSKNYHKKLTQRKKDFDTTHSHGDSSLNISDSSLDDSDVYTEYKKCVNSDAAHKGDSGKGDSGHKYRIMNNCSNAQAIKEKIKAHKEKVRDDEKYLKRPIVLKTSTLIDKRIKAAVDACLDSEKGGGTQEIVPPSSDPDNSGHTGYSGRLNWREITNP